MDLYGSVAIVTGGGSGIGRATALLLAERKARVAVCGRRPEALGETVAMIERSGSLAVAVVTDVREVAQVNAMVRAVLDQFGRIDVLVNNAGIAIAKPVVETTEEDWDEILNTNLKGPFLCYMAVLPIMMEACRGTIVNVSSVLGKSGIANMGAYCASKFGVVGLTQALAEEVKLKGIQIFAVCPGPTYTELHRRVVGDRLAELSMPPEKVAQKIVGLVRGEIQVSSGGAIVVDEHTPRLPPHGWKGKWREVARQWLGPAARILHRGTSLAKSDGNPR